MLKLSARKLIAADPYFLFDNLRGDLTLVFDDGEMITNARETIFSSFFWEFHRENPSLPILKKHHLRSYLGDTGDAKTTKKLYGSKHHLDIGGNIYWDAYDNRNSDNPFRFDYELNKLFFTVINNVYNFIAKLEGFELSFNIREYLEIRFHPIINESISKLERNPKSIRDTYQTVLHVIKNDPALDNNSLAKATRSGITREMQLIQCVAVRGYIEDNDSNIFEEPILRSFLDGLTMFENLIESRSASKSLLYNKKVIEFVEYFSRTMQLQAMPIKNLHKVDCGSTETISWTIRKPIYDSVGAVTRDSDLKYMQGKYYFDPDTDELKILKSSDTHLQGRRVRFRSMIAGCKHSDPNGVCSVCFSSLASSYDHNNLGQQTTAQFAAQQSQNVLSQKHAQSSSIAEPIVLSEEQAVFFTTNKEKDSYFLKESLVGKNYKIILNKDECPGFIDINNVNEVSDIGSITHVTELTSLTISLTSNGFEDSYSVPISIDRRLSSLSSDMLKYIKKYKPVVTETHYEIDMSHWNSKAPFAVLPLSQPNPYIRARRIRSLVLGDSKNATGRDREDAPLQLLQKLFDIVNSSMNVNIAILEVVVYSLMVKNSGSKDYFLPKAGDRMGLGVNNKVMAYRSLGGLLTYEDQAKVIMDSDMYKNRPRLDHPYDVLFKPQEHIEVYDPEALTSNR